MQRRILLPLALFLVALVVTIALWSLGDTGTNDATSTVHAVVSAPPSSAPVELAPVESVAARQTPIPVQKARPKVPVSEVAPQTLAIVLRHPNGRPLLDTLDRIDRDTADALRPMLLEACPRVGADLPSDARKLVHRTSDVSSERNGTWMKSSFREATRGCACVMLGERVLAAAPFELDQPTVELTVDPADLRVARRTLDVLVLDDQSRTPLAGAQVTLRPALGRVQTQQTDAHGRATWRELIPGEILLTVSNVPYFRAERRLTLPADHELPLETIPLMRKATIAGTVRWFEANPLPAHVVAIEGEPGRETQRLVTRDASGWTGTFRFSELRPGQYRVGIAGSGPYPTIEQARRREIEGWVLVDVRYADAETVWIDVTPAMTAAARASDSER